MTRTDQQQHFNGSVVEEVRAVREAIDEEVGHDIEKLAERAKRAGEKYRREHQARRKVVPTADAQVG